jgi:hypothetical protein
VLKLTDEPEQNPGLPVEVVIEATGNDDQVITLG